MKHKGFMLQASCFKMKYDIITFGSATRDVYIICKDFLVVEEKKFVAGKGIAVSLGSKIEADDIFFRTGGGGTNTASTFRKQGLKVAWCGMVGRDIGGREIMKELEARGIDTRFVKTCNKKPTNYSVILYATKLDRTILVYHGASSELTAKDVPWKNLQTAWFYLAPMSGKLAHLFPKVVDFALANKIKIAINPGNTQLCMSRKTLRKTLAKINILLVNQEEASLLTCAKFKNERDMMQKIIKFIGYNKIAIMTEGPLGVVVSDGKFLYRAPVVKTKVVDRTGAGDAFGSGFVAEFTKSRDIVKAMQFGMANSASCISRGGAKEGLLQKGRAFKKVKVSKYPLA